MKTTTQNTLKTVIAAAALVAGFATGAQAGDAPQIHVSYADLNLHTAAGAAVLNRRIKAAAEKVCSVFGDRDLARRAQFDACVTSATDGALATVKASNVQLASN